MRKFAKRLNELMEEKGISAYRLAKELGVDNQTILNWQGDKTEAKAHQIEQIAIFFDCTADYLLGITNFF